MSCICTRVSRNWETMINLMNKFIWKTNNAYTRILNHSELAAQQCTRARTVNNNWSGRPRALARSCLCVRCLFRVAAICSTNVRKHFNGYCLKPSSVEMLRKTTITSEPLFRNSESLQRLNGSRIAVHDSLSSQHYRIFCIIIAWIRARSEHLNDAKLSIASCIVMAQHAFIRDYFFFVICIRCTHRAVINIGDSSRMKSAGIEQWPRLSHKWWCVDKAYTVHIVIMMATRISGNSNNDRNNKYGTIAIVERPTQKKTRYRTSRAW